MNAYSSVIGIWLENAKKGLPIVVYGTGDQRRDFIHSADVANINYKCYRLLESGVKIPEVLNVGTGKTHSLNEIILMFKKHKDIRVIRKDSRPGEASVTHASTKLLHEYIENYNFRALETYIEEHIYA
jgi:UDP-glucose 4-epimerase